MKTVLSVVAIVLVLFVLATGCETGAGITSSPEGETVLVASSLGDLHNEFLARVHQKRLTDDDPIDSATNAANEIASLYGAELLTREEVEQALGWGSEMALKDPLDLIRTYLHPEEFAWFMEMSEEVFAEEGSIEEVEQRIADFKQKRPVPCGVAPVTGASEISSYLKRYPDQGPAGEEIKRLDGLTEVMIASSKYWSSYRPDYKQKLKLAVQRHAINYVNGEYIAGEIAEGEENTWVKRVFRFLCFVAVDSVAGAMSAPCGGPAGAGIVGGLASLGADCLLFPEGDS